MITTMIAQVLLLLVFPALLMAASVWDLGSFTIPNWVQIALVGAFVIFAFACRMAPETFGWHVLSAVIALVISFTLFALGYIGGGDAKLFAATALWLGFSSLFAYTLFATVAGGVMALSLVMLRRWPLPAFLAHQGWIARLHDTKSGMPYGVALAAGALLLLPQTELFRLAAGS